MARGWGLIELIDRLIADPRYRIRRDGTIWTTKALGNGHQPCPWRRIGNVNGHGYEQISYQSRLVDVHRIVYRKFKGPLLPPLEIDHKDGDTLNNRPGNLQQISVAGNRRKGRKMKLTAEAVEEMRQLRRQGWKLTQLAERFEVTMQTVSKVCRGDRWAEGLEPETPEPRRWYRPQV